MTEKKITELLRRLSFGNGNMIAPGDNGFSFRIDGFPANIPKGVHFTFGFNRETGDINLHVTRNVQDQNNKPHVKVAIVHKHALSEAFPKLATRLLKIHLIPLTVLSGTRKTKYKVYQQRQFLDLSAIEAWSDYEEGEFLPEAATHFKKRGGNGKYEMQSTFEAGMQKWSRSKFRIKALRAAIKPLRDMDITQAVWGLLFSAEYTGPALIINGGIYVFRADVSLSELFTALLGKTTVQQLSQRIRDAILLIQNAKSYDDSKDAAAPVRLFLNYGVSKKLAETINHLPA